MRERILHILQRFRRRMLAVRAAEAAAVAGSAGALAAAFLMAARILTGQYPSAAAGLCAAPLAAGVLLAGWGRARRPLSGRPFLQWFVAVLLVACGGAALAALFAGRFAAVPKNALLLIAPAAAAAAAAVVLVRPAPLRAVAALLDQRAALQEKLSTAWELPEGAADSSFARAVRDQAAAAAESGGLARIRFWDRTPATLGALGLALAAAALMLPWEPLESPAARQARLWRAAAPQAAEAIELELPALRAQDLALAKDLEPPLRRLEALTRLLRSPRPQEAGQWEGRVVELGRIAEALRQIRRGGRADPTTARRITRLLDAIERASADIAEAMAAGGRELARAGADAVDPGKLAPAPTSQTQPVGWATVFDPRYPSTSLGAVSLSNRADLARPPTATAPAGGNGGEPGPQTPYDQKWAAARARAAQALAQQPIPPQYRQLIRDFFAPDQP